MGSSFGIYAKDIDSQKTLDIVSIYGSHPFFEEYLSFFNFTFEKTEVLINYDVADKMLKHFRKLSEKFLNNYKEKRVYQIRDDSLYPVDNEDAKNYDETELVGNSHDLYLSFLASDCAAKIIIILDPLEFESLNKGYEFYAYLSV